MSIETTQRHPDAEATAPLSTDPVPSGTVLLSIGVGLLTTVVYSVFSAQQWGAMTSPSWDLGIFTQLAQRYAGLQSPIVTIKGEDVNLLGDHFHPLLILLAPVYALFPHAFTLVVVQNVLFGVASAVIAYGGIRLLGTLTGTLLGLAFGLSWGLQGAVAVQFHEIAFAVPLLALSLVALLLRKWWASVLWALPLVFVKEDLGLTVAAIGILLAFRSRHTIGIWLAVWGVAWFAIASLVVLPWLNPAGRWAYSGSLNPAGLWNDPLTLLQPEKGMTLLLLLAASGALVLRSPLALVLLPTLAWRFLSDNHGYWGPGWQYSAVLMPIAFCAMIDAILALRRSRQRWLRAYGRYSAAVVFVVALTLVPTLPLAALGTAPGPDDGERRVAAEGALASIPGGSRVESDIGLMNYLVERHQVYWVGNDNPVPDYLVVDLRFGGLPEQWGSVAVVARARHPGTEFRTVYSVDGIQVAVNADRFPAR